MDAPLTPWDPLDPLDSPWTPSVPWDPEILPFGPWDPEILPLDPPLRALGLLLADGALTVGWGKTFWRVDRVFFLRKRP